jgi:hypothetical protein
MTTETGQGEAGAGTETSGESATGEAGTTSTTESESSGQQGGQGESSGQGESEGQGESSGDSPEVRELKAALAAQRREAAAARKRADAAERKGMTESEQAIAAARDEGRAAALTELGATLAEARFRSTAAGKVSDVDQVVKLAGDMSRFVAEDGKVDEDAITEAVEGFAKLGPATGGAGQTIRKGVSENGASGADGNAWMRGAISGS